MFNFQWHITDRCNLRCLHCYQSDYSKGADTGFLLAVAEKIIHELELKNYTTCINLTGGEPLLEKKSLLTLLDFLNQNPRVQELMIITNGLLLDDAYLKELKRFPKLTTIKLSLEGATAATNDFIRGEGTYDAITQKIRLLKSYQQFYAVLMFTLQKRNFPEIESMFALSETLNLDGLILERFIPEGRGKKF